MQVCVSRAGGVSCVFAWVGVARGTTDCEITDQFWLEARAAARGRCANPPHACACACTDGGKRSRLQGEKGVSIVQKMSLRFRAKKKREKKKTGRGPRGAQKRWSLTHRSQTPVSCPQQQRQHPAWPRQLASSAFGGWWGRQRRGWERWGRTKVMCVRCVAHN